MSFLSGLGKGLHRAFDGNNLAMAQALLAGDYQSAAAITARQEELQRHSAMRNAQVRAAKDFGIDGAVIPALNNDDLSAVTRRSYLAGGYGPQAGGAGDADDGAPQGGFAGLVPAPP